MEERNGVPGLLLSLLVVCCGLCVEVWVEAGEECEKRVGLSRLRCITVRIAIRSVGTAGGPLGLTCPRLLLVRVDAIGRRQGIVVVCCALQHRPRQQRNGRLASGREGVDGGTDEG